MTLSEYLKICREYVLSSKNVFEFMSDFFRTITSFDDSDDDETCPFQTSRNKSSAIKIYGGERKLSYNHAVFVRTHIDEESFDRLIDGLDDHVKNNLIDDLYNNFKIDATFDELSGLMCKLLCNCLDDIIKDKEKKNKKKKTAHKKQDNKTKKETNSVVIEEKTVKISNEVNENNKKSNYSPEVLNKANNFCIDYENEKDLFVLCQIAKYIAPRHKHVREMYTAYLRLEEDVQNAIMEINEIPILSFEELWEYAYLEYFREDIEKLGLWTDTDLLYEGGKYFHRAKNYSNMNIYDPDPVIFPSVPSFKIKVKEVDLIEYIDEHLYYRDDKEMSKYVGEPPFDWMVNNLALKRCDESELTYWMCLFIYSACHVIPRYYGRKDPCKIDHNAPNLDLAEYLEDMYYMALLALYDIYSN